MPKISELPAGTVATGSEKIPAVQNGQTVYLTAAQATGNVTPIVILATGQSNFVQNPALSWTPSSNAYSWTFSGSTLFTDGAVGTSFEPLTTNYTTKIRQPEKFASDIARANPGRPVYVVNIAIGSQAISQWLVGASAPDMFANIQANISPALVAIGATKIDYFLWWEGENQTSEPWLYVDNFNTMIARFQAQSWFPLQTPIIVYGVAPTSISGNAIDDVVNSKLQAAVRSASDTRRFVYTASLGSTIWADTLHMTAAGHFAAGELASATALHGETHQPLIDPLTNNLRPSVFGRPAYRNLVTGGDFTVNPWISGTSFAAIADGTAFATNWTWVQSGAGVVTLSQGTDGPTIAQAGTYAKNCIDVNVTTADASIGLFDYYGVQAAVAGNNCSFLGFGQTSALPITVSFWVKSSIVGNYFVAVENSAQNRSFNTQYQVDVADTWEKKFVTITGDTSGTWLTASGSVGLRLFFTIASGDNYLFGPDIWNAADVRVGNVTRANGVSTIGNRFKLALVQVEEGIGPPSVYDRTPQTIARTDTSQTFTGTQTIGALVVTGASALGATTVSATMTPLANDGAALGTTALSFSDLFLASGGVLNFNNGNYTVTHSAGLLTFSGAVTHTGATTLTGALTYGGVALANAVTGTGNMVLSATPTFTGTPILAAPSATTLIVGSSATFPASPAPITFTANTTTLPAPAAGTVLHVAGADGATAGLLVDGFAGTPSLMFRTALTSAAAKSAVTSGTVIMNFGALAFGATVYSGSKLQIVGKATENWTDGAQGTSIQFNTTPNTTTTAALAMIIQPSGGVGVGTTTDPGIGAILANTSIKSKGATAGIGYTTGAGGTISQGTNRTTGVTLDTVTGAITLFSQVNTAVSLATAQTFTLTSAAIAAADVVHVTQKTGTDKYLIFVTATAAGSCQITNFTTGGTTNEAPVFSFAVIKGVTS